MQVCIGRTLIIDEKKGMQNFMYGKAIELFLVNGSADSLTTAELSNWNGKAIKIPRTEISGCHREDIKGVGVQWCQNINSTSQSESFSFRRLVLQ